MTMMATSTATATQGGGDIATTGEGKVERDSSSVVVSSTSQEADVVSVVVTEQQPKDESEVVQDNITDDVAEKQTTEEVQKEEVVPLTIEGEESAEQKANAYQLHRRHFRTPSLPTASSSDNNQEEGEEGNNNNNPALGIDHPDYSSEKELYRQRSADVRGRASSSSDSVVVEETPLDLPCHLLNEEQVRRDQHIYPIVLNYTHALANIVDLLQALREQYTAEHHYVCPTDKMRELRKLLNVFGELQYLHTRRDKLRLLGGNSFGTLGPLCASHIIVASDVFKTWAVAIETVFNGLSASEGHCTTGWANFLAFLSNAPGLQEPQLRTPECMKRPSYARCFLNN